MVIHIGVYKARAVLPINLPIILGEKSRRFRASSFILAGRVPPGTGVGI
jgi:hypothetical protein